MVTSRAYPDDGIWVMITVDRKSRSVLGKDFVSGGLHDYASSTVGGFRVTLKTERHADYKKAVDIAYNLMIQELGSPPGTLPATHASRLIVLEWNGESDLSEEELLNLIGIGIKDAKLKKHLLW